MIAVSKVIAVVAKSKDMRTQGACGYKRKTHFLRTAERKEHVKIQKIDE
jgi:hypothetical protein